MKGIPADTTIEAARMQYEILSKLSPERRAIMAFEASDMLRSIVEAGVKLRHPDYNKDEISKEVLRLMVGNRLFKQIYPDAEK